MKRKRGRVWNVKNRWNAYELLKRWNPVFVLIFLKLFHADLSILIRGYKAKTLIEVILPLYFELEQWRWNSNDKNLEYCELPSIRFWKIKLNDSNYCHSSSFFGSSLVFFEITTIPWSLFPKSEIFFLIDLSIKVVLQNSFYLYIFQQLQYHP